MRHTILAAAFAALPLAASAENVALILANTSYDSLPDLRIGDEIDDAVAAFAGAGFAVIEVRDARFAAAASALAETRERIEAADRVALLVAGHFAQGDGGTWLLSRDARQPDLFNVGAQAVPMAPLLSLAAGHPGAAAVLIADETGRVRLGPGLAAGAAPSPAPQGVAVFTGTARGIAATLEDGLLEPARSLRDVAEDLPSGVAAEGFLSGRAAFVPGEGGEVVVTARPAQPVEVAPAPAEAETVTLPPVQALDPSGAEAALGLSREARRAVQRDLELLGYDPRGIDGVFGRGTRSAIAAWQRANGAPETGYLTGNQVVLLQEQGAERSAALEAEAARRQADEDRQDAAYWQETGSGGTEQGLRAYLARYPDGLYAARARASLEPFEAERRAQAAAADRQAWDVARGTDSVEAYRAYLSERPEGAFRREAEARIAALSEDEAGDRAVAAARAEETAVAANPIARLLIEQRLNQLGYEPGAIDGAFDEETRRGIRRFQRARDIPVTGYVGQATMARLLAP
jgi:peptidoglycan hydrolase-like protein with peptidoglycan-binding domain